MIVCNQFQFWLFIGDFNLKKKLLNNEVSLCENLSFGCISTHTHRGKCTEIQCTNIGKKLKKKQT